MTTTVHLPSFFKQAAGRLRRIGVELSAPILPDFLSIADEIGVDVANLDAELGEAGLSPALAPEKQPIVEQRGRAQQNDRKATTNCDNR